MDDTIALSPAGVSCCDVRPTTMIPSASERLS
jgi:hypothetical protein